MESPFLRRQPRSPPSKRPFARIRNCENSCSTEEIVNGGQKTTRDSGKFLSVAGAEPGTRSGRYARQALSPTTPAMPHESTNAHTDWKRAGSRTGEPILRTHLPPTVGSRVGAYRSPKPKRMRLCRGGDGRSSVAGNDVLRCADVGAAAAKSRRSVEETLSQILERVRVH
jgi:hypothetical protein